MKHERIEIGAVRPYDRPRVFVHPDLGEIRGVAQRLEHAFKSGCTPNVDLTLHPVVESQTEAVGTGLLYKNDARNHHRLLQRGDRLERLLSPGQGPVLHELSLMLHRPLHHES